MSYEYICPICGGEEHFLKRDTHPSNVTVSTSIGGGRCVCRRCARERKDEIEKQNERFGTKLRKKDPNCKHEWEAIGNSRWYCPKCGADYNIMCGCGGSGYVCQKHYDEFIEEMKKECGSVEAFLAKHSR